jgi:hypothetical protein
MHTDDEGVTVMFTQHELQHLVREIHQIITLLPDYHLIEVEKLQKKLVGD